MRDVSKGRQLFQHRGFFCYSERGDNDKEKIILNINRKRFNDLKINLIK